jgi:hypothetical protein
MASTVLLSHYIPSCLKAVYIYVFEIDPDPSLSTIWKALFIEILDDFMALKNRYIACSSFVLETPPALFIFLMN